MTEMKLHAGKGGFVRTDYLRRVDSSRPASARLRDWKRTASEVYDLPVTPGQAVRWANNPGRIDIRGIDAPAPARDGIGVQKGIRIHGTKADDRMIRSILSDAFSPEELRALGTSVKHGTAGIDIWAEPFGNGADGAYDGRDLGFDIYSDDPARPFVHEAVHAMRDRDAGRRGLPRTPVMYEEGIGADEVSMEESLTVAEQMAREGGHRQSDPYYDSVPVWDGHRWRKPRPDEAERMYREDLRLLKNTPGTPSQKTSAVWTRMHLARLRLGGMTAIQYAEMEGYVPPGTAQRNADASMGKKHYMLKKKLSTRKGK